jgi:hypothetical protein
LLIRFMTSPFLPRSVAPKLRKLRRVRLGRAGAFRIEAIAGAGPVDVAPDEPGVPELLEVLGDGRLGERQEADEPAADAASAAGQDLEDADADRWANALASAAAHEGRIEGAVLLGPW